MSSDGDEKKWICGGATVNLHRVSSIVREIRDPCLHRTPNRGSKMLRPEKWQSIFDDDGKAVCFRKALKLIILGGVDPSIRPEVWEFLLGCYALSSTAEYRRQLRMARRERYQDLIRECRSMHSSIGTGTLAYAVGSKVLDVRTLSKDNGTREEESRTDLTHTDNCNNKESYSNLGNNGALTYAKYQGCSSESVDLLSVRGSTDSAVCDTVVHSSDTYSGFSIKSRGEDVGSHFPSDSYFDFPPLPVTNLFQKISEEEEEEEVSGCHSFSEQTLGSTDKAMHSFQINNNIDLVMESNDMLSANSFLTSKSNAENFSADVQRHAHGLHNWEENKVVNRLRISDVPQASAIATSTSNMLTANEDRVSEWLWTLHRIVVDVVRTDSHLEFYENSTNMARMSDILAVYAWVDPATGYCQGMSDLLSPFVVLYEDNADAFWCFEMLLRRMRENFQMEGPTGVMKQLQALWKILELTDTEIFTHLSLIGAESLHFAFRMLLVLFRRELSFSEALCMWEMMWAADFDEAAARELDENCLEPLVLQLPRDSNSEMGTDITPNCKEDSQCERHEHCNEETVASHDDEIMPDPSHPFCGLTKASFWARPQHLQVCALSASVKNSDDELPVFCVAAILITNRQKIIRETHSIDDVIKMFNDNMLKINVKRCIRMAIKLRKKYFYKIAKRTAWEVLSASTI